MFFSKGKPKFCIIKMKTGIKNRVKGILSSLLRQGLHTPRPEAEAGFATEALFFKKNKKEDFKILFLESKKEEIDPGIFPKRLYLCAIKR